MPTHVVYKGKHYELPVDGLTPEDALLRVRNLLGETGDGTQLRRLQPGATAPEGFEPDAPANQDTAAEAGIYTQPSTPTMLKTLALEASPMLATAPAVLSKVLPMLPRALGGITGAMEGNKQGGALGAVVGGATGVALPGATGAGAGALEGYEMGGVPGLLAGAALGSLGGRKGRMIADSGRRIIGRLGKLALEAPEAAADVGTAAKATEAAKAASEVKAAETLAPKVESTLAPTSSGAGTSFPQTTTQPSRVVGSIGRLPLQGPPAAYTDAGDAILGKVRQLMSMPGGKDAVREYLKSQPPEVALELTKKLGRYAFSQ